MLAARSLPVAAAATAAVDSSRSNPNGRRRCWLHAGIPSLVPRGCSSSRSTRSGFGLHPSSSGTDVAKSQCHESRNLRRSWVLCVEVVDEDFRLLSGSGAVAGEAVSTMSSTDDGAGGIGAGSGVRMENDIVDAAQSSLDGDSILLREENKNGSVQNSNLGAMDAGKESVRVIGNKRLERMSRRKGQQVTYLMAAVASSTGFVTMAAAAVIYRFVWQMPASGEIPYVEIFGTFSLAAGAAIGMEFWARWAHKALWHASLWNMHESHHRPREGPFEMNDVFAIINAVPAISLMLYGFLNKGLVPGLCFGAGLGITMFGIAYMFVHDGLVHRRFPVGPIAEVPYLQKVAAAHQLHHADLFEGVPYGLFLGPRELEKVGGEHELEKLLQQRAKK